MARSKRTGEQRHRSSAMKACKVQPAAPGAQPWFGEVVDPERSQFSRIMTRSDVEHYVIVRCTDSCSARGVRVGAEYFVRTDFVSYTT